MNKTISLTERELAILDDMVSTQIDMTQENKRSVRTTISNPSLSDNLRKALDEYDYFTEQLHALYQLKSKLNINESFPD